jgi:nicotinate-nucleotide pyrophosphorylase
MDNKDQKSTEKTDTESTEVTEQATETPVGGINKKMILIVALIGISLFSVVAPEAFAKSLDLLWSIIY